MTSPQEKRWWFSVLYVADSVEPVWVERFETQEQAALHAAATDGYVLGPHDLGDLAYDHYLRLSERTE